MKEINDEKIIERLIERIDYANTFFLKNIGSSIKKISELTPTQAQQLVNILKYGGNYEDIIKQISKYTDLNVKEVQKIFKTYAQKDQQFYKQFYKYRNKPFIPFDKNIVLQRQTQAIVNIAQNEMFNFSRTNVLGYTIKDLNGKKQFLGLRDTYNRVLDEALLNVSQGKATFDSEMSRVMEDIGGSGLKTLEYESGRSIRLDSAVRMHLKGRLRELHNENQRIIGEEIDADGVEISVHSNPAVDHELAQGRQFTFEEFEKLNAGLEATDYKGEKITLGHSKNGSYRPISEYNCYHYVFTVVLGVSKPEYNQKQLNVIHTNNKNGFELDGKHYSNYEGTQLQRQIERRIREQKDIQIFAKASGNNELVAKAQNKITQLTHKYKELSDVSGLPTKLNRLRVNNYKKVAIKK